MKIVKQYNSGFTLVELIVITGILVLCGGVIASIIFNTLRGSKKSANTNAVTQNGNFALSSITEVVNKADGIVSTCNNTSSKILLLSSSKTNTVYTISCIGETNINISQSNQATGIPIGLPVSLLSPGVRLSDNSCSLKCTQAVPNITGAISPNPFIKPLIEISFVLTDLDRSTAADTRAQATFRTSVLMRSYEP